jgi:hypothetical protein
LIVDEGNRLQAVVKKLKANRFDAILVDTIEDARARILEIVPQNATVGTGNSVTLRQLGIAKALEERGTTVLDPVAPSYGLAEFKEEMIMPTLLKATLGSDVFISGTNALTEDGKLVNIDGLGNRVAGIMFGARTSIVVVGRNKVVKNVDDALFRIKNTITPAMTKRRELPVPCAKAGKCVDCSMPERGCNITVIMEKKPPLTDVKVIVVDDDLGLGWDPEWPAERIETIRKKYELFDWPYVPAWMAYKKKSENKIKSKEPVTGDAK